MSDIKQFYTGKWVIDEKQHPNGVQLSVLRDDNVHGKRSYGWPDENAKIIILNGDIREKFYKTIREPLLAEARRLADKLNARDAAK